MDAERSRLSRAWPVLVLVGSSTAAFGLCGAVVLGLALGGAVGGLPGGLVGGLLLTVGYVLSARWAWRRLRAAAGR